MIDRKEAIDILRDIWRFQKSERYSEKQIRDALVFAIEALRDNKPSRIWIAKNEYRRGWHDALKKALSEVMKIYVGNEIFDIVQKETLIGLGLSMDSALGAEPYSETEGSYPEPDRPHGEWISRRNKQGTHIYSVCSRCNAAYLDTDFPNFCPNCGSDNRETSPTKDCMRRGEQLREWILQGMKEGMKEGD